MQYVKLGATGLDVSPIAIGAMTFGEPERGHPAWSLGEEESRKLIKHALDVGINFFDTANIYSQDSSEEILGRALKDYVNRDDVVIATKLRHPMRSGPNGKGLSRKAIMTEVEHSLSRLGTDYIDLYQIHRNDHTTPLEETLEALHDLVKAGKVRYLGASSMPAWEFAKALYLQRERGWARFVSMQDYYNLLAREEEREMIPLCLDEGVGTIIWSPLARGRLARAWSEAKSTTRSTNDDFADMLYTPFTEASDKAIIEAVGKIASDRGRKRAQIALAWLRSKPVVTTPLVGASSIGQIDDAIASLDIELTEEEIHQLETPYTPRYDFQGISDDAQLQAIMAKIPQFTTVQADTDVFRTVGLPAQGEGALEKPADDPCLEPLSSISKNGTDKEKYMDTPSSLHLHTITLSHKELTLRPMTEDDWHMLYAWNNDSDVLYFSEGDDITRWSLEDLQCLYRSLSQNAFLFMLEVQGRPIGEGWLQKMNLTRILERYPGQDCRRIDLAIGEKDLWGHGYGTRTIQLLTQLAFDLGTDAVFGLDIADYNPRSRRAFEKVGYQLDQVIASEPGAKARQTYDLIFQRPIWQTKQNV